MSVRRTLSRALAAAAAFGALGPVPAAAAADEPSPPPWLKVEDGQTQPQFAFEDAIEQTVFVETELDSDADGRRDRVRIQISRPLETQTRGYKVPVVFEHSPYRGDFGDAVNHPVDFEFLPQEFLGEDGGRARGTRASRLRRKTNARAARARMDARADLPDSSLDNYYVPRGYAVVLGESIGTFNSDGCPTVGDRVETLGTKAVIDWLNGRARGFDEAGKRVTAGWTTGAVGMTGVSYNGTLPNQVATTGVEGLETIIPVSAISSWYDYYRANGLVVAPHSETQGVGENVYLGEDTDVLASFIGGSRMADRCARTIPALLRAQDRVTGDWSPFWEARDYLDDVRRIRASVFVVHGLNDWNVKTKAFAEWWYRLHRYGIERKLWLHNGGHGGPQGEGAAAYEQAENRWLDRWLFGVANGIEDEPRLTIQREDGAYSDEADWPVRGSRPAMLRLSARRANAPGELSSRRATRDRRTKQSFIDRGREFDTDDVLIQGPDEARPDRLVYRSPELARAVRLSGTPFVRLRMSLDNRNAANLTAVLVDYGAEGSSQAPVMVTRGWLDPQNRAGTRRSRAIRQGKPYRFRWDLQPDDYVFQAGHRIGLVVVSTDHDYTIRPAPGTELALHPADSRITLPVVGGAAALRF
ncbi:MAG TPA: Xaa-Pro dipeptidyl-peptidase [Thermoleophilaceae bacterium]|nr:Xaa-Pro dipeptidyl-peptidase [Thermoleophilaceae bacterium]